MNFGNMIGSAAHWMFQPLDAGLSSVNLGDGWNLGASSGLRAFAPSTWSGLFGPPQAAAPDDKWDENVALQKEFAQHGIRWKVEDAKAAGLSPLAALGAPTSSFSPVAVGQDNSVDRMSGMGQDILRAVTAMSSRNERAEKLADLQIENQGLQNQMLASQIAKLNQAPSPGLPSNSGMSPFLTGQGDSFATTGGYVTEKPVEREHSQPGRPAQSAGEIPDYGYVRTSSGLAIIPSKDVKERIEDQFVPETMWAVRNQMVPYSKGLPPPDPRYFPLPKGASSWKWNPLAQEFQPHYAPEGSLNYYFDKGTDTSWFRRGRR